MQTFTAHEYIKIDIASNFGLDKKTWTERLQWFNQNEHQLEALVSQADNPALFVAGVMAHEKAMKKVPSGYPISLDATSSGIQILACLTGDRVAASLCNVINLDDDHRADFYTHSYEYMKEIAPAYGVEVGNIKRDDTKKAAMTSFYGSEAMPKQIYGGDTPLLRLFFKAMETMAPGPWELNKVFLSIWNPEATQYTWVMPDGFNVHFKVEDSVEESSVFMGAPVKTYRKVEQATENGRCLAANTTHSIDGMIVREMSRRCNYDEDAVKQLKYNLTHYGTEDDQEIIGGTKKDQDLQRVWSLYKQSGYLSARILTLLDCSNLHCVKASVVLDLINSLPKKSFKVISVHDCFRCLPNYANDLRKQYVLQLHLIAKSNMLNFLMSQIMGKQVDLGIKCDFADEILNAEYALS